MKHHGENNTIQLLRYKTDIDNENALEGCVSFNCQLGIPQEESLREGVSSPGWPSDSSDKTMRNSILIAGLRCEGPPTLIGASRWQGILDSVRMGKAS